MDQEKEALSKGERQHFQGRFSGRLETKEDETRLAQECKLLAPLLGGVGKRGEKSRSTLAKVVRGIASGDVRRFCQRRELIIREQKAQILELKGQASESQQLRAQIQQLQQECDQKTQYISQLAEQLQGFASEAVKSSAQFFNGSLEQAQQAQHTSAQNVPQDNQSSSKAVQMEQLKTQGVKRSAEQASISHVPMSDQQQLHVLQRLAVAAYEQETQKNALPLVSQQQSPRDLLAQYSKQPRVDQYNLSASQRNGKSTESQILQGDLGEGKIVQQLQLQNNPSVQEILSLITKANQGSPPSNEQVQDQSKQYFDNSLYTQSGALQDSHQSLDGLARSFVAKAASGLQQHQSSSSADLDAIRFNKDTSGTLNFKEDGVHDQQSQLSNQLDQFLQANSSRAPSQMRQGGEMQFHGLNTSDLNLRNDISQVFHGGLQPLGNLKQHGVIDQHRQHQQQQPLQQQQQQLQNLQQQQQSQQQFQQQIQRRVDDGSQVQQQESSEASFNIPSNFLQLLSSIGSTRSDVRPNNVNDADATLLQLQSSVKSLSGSECLELIKHVQALRDQADQSNQCLK